MVFIRRLHRNIEDTVSSVINEDSNIGLISRFICFHGVSMTENLPVGRCPADE